MMKIFCTTLQNVAFNPLIEQLALVPLAPLHFMEREREIASKRTERSDIDAEGRRRHRTLASVLPAHHPDEGYILISTLSTLNQNSSFLFIFLKIFNNFSKVCYV
ncbi:MAG: hypothetical protein ACP5I9_10050 [Candidatus Kapaibacteriota bacterium]